MNADEKRTAKIALLVVRKLIAMSNEHGSVLFERDFGHDRSLTLAIPRNTHIGTPDSTYSWGEERFLTEILDGLNKIDEWAAQPQVEDET